jgi:hypothetical protein
VRHKIIFVLDNTVNKNMIFHLGYSMSGADFIFREMAKVCFKETTILTIETHKQCLHDYSGDHLVSCYKNLEAFFNHDIPLGDMGKDDVHRCASSPCYAINVPPEKLDIRHGDNVTLHMLDPLLSVSNAYTMIKDSKHPWMRSHLHDFYLKCSQFSHPPSLHWFSPSQKEVEDDFRRVAEYTKKITLIHQNQVLHFLSPDVKVKVHLINDTGTENYVDITAFEDVSYTSVTSKGMEDVTCTTLKEYRSGVGISFKECPSIFDKYILFLLAVPFLFCWCFISKNRNRGEEEVVPLKN